MQAAYPDASIDDWLHSSNPWSIGYTETTLLLVQGFPSNVKWEKQDKIEEVPKD